MDQAPGVLVSQVQEQEEVEAGEIGKRVAGAGLEADLVDSGTATRMTESF